MQELKYWSELMITLWYMLKDFSQCNLAIECLLTDRKTDN